MLNDGNFDYARKIDMIIKMVKDDDMTIIVPDIEPADFDGKEHQVMCDLEKMEITFAVSNHDKVTNAVIARIGHVQGMAMKQGDLDEYKNL